MPSDSGSLVTDGSDAASFDSEDYSDIHTPPSPTVSIDTICKRMEGPFNQEDDKRTFAEMQMELFKLKFKCQLLDRQGIQLHDRLTRLDTSHVHSPQDDSPASSTPKFITQSHAFDFGGLDPSNIDVDQSHHFGNGITSFTPSGIPALPVHAHINPHIPTVLAFVPTSSEPPW